MLSLVIMSNSYDEWFVVTTAYSISSNTEHLPTTMK